MSKKTSYSSTDGKFTGKQVTERSNNGSTSTTNYKVTDRNILGSNFKATSTTVTDSKGNSRTKTYK